MTPFMQNVPYANGNTETQASKLCVMIPYFNLAGYKGAIERYNRCTASLTRQGVQQFTVEVALKDCTFELNGSNVLKLRAEDCLWHKEAALNALVKHVPPEYTSVVWMDRDILLLNDNWPRSAAEALQKYKVVQLFEELEELGQDGAVQQSRTSAVAAYLDGLNPVDAINRRYHGGAWAMRRDLFEQCGLFDLAIVGGGDTMFLLGCLGLLEKNPQWLWRFNEHIRHDLAAWGQMLYKEVHGNVGNIPVKAQHLWHGTFSNRRYGERHAILNDMYPERDLVRNANGLWSWSAEANADMRDAVKQYFADRQEDGEQKRTFDFTTDWFSNKIPLFQTLLAEYAGQENIQFLEIGSWEGRSACWLIENVLTHPTSRLTCVDTFEGSIEHHAKNRGVHHIEERFDHNVSLLLNKGAVQKLKGNSQHVLCAIGTDTFDCIFIDGSHIAADVLTDIVNAWRLLKVGGIMILDDYEHDLFENNTNNPKVAIDAFLGMFHAEVELLEKGRVVAVRKCTRLANFATLSSKYLHGKRQWRHTCVSISWIRNEEDIVESFVRHHADVFDEMIIVLHNCKDRSEEILHDLRSAGFPLDIQTKSVPYHAQGEVLTEIMHSLASRSCRWIVPLDADELLCSEKKDTRYQLQNTLNTTVYALPWKTYVPTPYDSDAGDVRKRITHRRAMEPRQFAKIMIPGHLADRAVLPRGNHQLLHMNSKTPFPSMEHSSLFLAHFPVRTEVQLRNKILTNWHAVNAHPDFQPGSSFQWQKLVERCRNPTQLSRTELQEMAMQYATFPGDPQTELVYEPVSGVSGAIPVLLST